MTVELSLKTVSVSTQGSYQTRGQLPWWPYCWPFGTMKRGSCTVFPGIFRGKNVQWFRVFTLQRTCFYFARKVNSNVETIAKQKFLYQILQCLISDDVGSEIFSVNSYLFHKLASRVDSKCYETGTDAKSRKSMKYLLTTVTPVLNSWTNAGKVCLGNVKKCHYDDICKSRVPDKELRPHSDVSKETIPVCLSFAIVLI